MGKKTKKAAQAEGLATEQSTKKQAKKETQTENEEGVPPTIFEATKSELFAQSQDVVPSTELSPESNQDQAVIQPAPKPKVSKRPYIQDVESLLEAGTHSRAEIIAFVLEKYPTVTKGGIQTFVTDLRNPKYCHFKDRKVVLYGSEGKLIFEDKIPATEATKPQEAASNEGQTTGESVELPAE